MYSSISSDFVVGLVTLLDITMLTSGVNFINVFRECILYEFLAPSYFSAWRQIFVQKKPAKNVDEIDCTQYTQLEVAPNYYAVGSMQYTCKLIVNLVLQNCKSYS